MEDRSDLPATEVDALSNDEESKDASRLTELLLALKSGGSGSNNM